MNPNTSQAPTGDNQNPQMAQQGQKIDPNQAMSNLGFANNMLSHLMKYKAGAPTAPQASQQPQEQTATEEQPNQKTENMKGEMHGKMAEQELKMTKDFMGQMDKLRSDMDSKLDNIKEQIQQALTNEQ